MPSTMSLTNSSSHNQVPELGAGKLMIIANDGPDDAHIAIGTSAIVATPANTMVKAGMIMSMGCSVSTNHIAGVAHTTGRTASIRISSPY